MVNEINARPSAVEPTGKIGQEEHPTLRGRPAKAGSRSVQLFGVAVVGVVLGLAVAYLGILPLSGRKSDAAPAVIPAKAAGLPGLERANGEVIVPEGSPYRTRLIVAPVQLRSLQQTRAVPAIVEAEPSRTFNILPPLGGRVTQLNVRLGDHVNAGQTLAAIDSGDLAQAYSDAEKARALVVLTKRALDRARGLNQVGGGAVKDVDSAANDAAQAESEFNRAEARLKAIAGSAGAATAPAVPGNPAGTGPAGPTRTLTVSAPASGNVTALAIAPGSYINDATQTMLTITNLERVWVTANVPESDIGFVFKDQDVDVSFVAYPGQVFHGKVLFVNDLMESDTRRTKVRIGFDNPDGRFKPNMFATVTFRAPPRQVLFVPDSALLMNNDSTTVFVETKPWTFVRRAVQTSYAAEGFTLVSAGLAPGERIVTSGGVLLND